MAIIKEIAPRKAKKSQALQHLKKKASSCNAGMESISFAEALTEELLPLLHKSNAWHS